MKKFEKFAILLIILWLLQKPIGHLITIVYYSLCAIEQIGEFSLWSYFTACSLMFFGSMVHILIGIWLFIQVKKEKAGAPWVWLMLGIFTGIYAPLLYFILRIYLIVKPNNELATEHTE